MLVEAASANYLVKLMLLCGSSFYVLKETLVGQIILKGCRAQTTVIHRRCPQICALDAWDTSYGAPRIPPMPSLSSEDSMRQVKKCSCLQQKI